MIIHGFCLPFFNFQSLWIPLVCRCIMNVFDVTTLELFPSQFPAIMSLTNTFSMKSSTNVGLKVDFVYY
jgi:hypothetical protein